MQLQGAEIAADLDRQRDVYREVARCGSQLYFLITQLAAVNGMYEFALPAFSRLFQANLAASNKDGGGERDMAAYIRRVNSGLTLSVFEHVTRSLFKADRLMFALHLVHCMRPELFEEREWPFFTGELHSCFGGFVLSFFCVCCFVISCECLVVSYAFLSHISYASLSHR
jgi:dynein heavy chain 2